MTSTITEDEGTTEAGKKPQNLAEFKEWIKNNPPMMCAHLLPFLWQEREKFANSALDALFKFDRIHYIKQAAKILPIDKNSGIIQTNTTWGEGLHQFVQVQTLVDIEPLTMTTAYSNNLSLLRSCRKVTSITGTVGSQPERAFLERLYNMGTVVIPRYKKSLFERYGDRICDDKEEWMQLVCEQVFINGII
jgi:preprotein translocase subunit SecA